MPGPHLRPPRHHDQARDPARDQNRDGGHEFGDQASWLVDLDLRRARLEDQIDIIREGHPDIVVQRDGNGDPELLYQPGVILVREENLAAVSAVVTGTEDRVRPVAGLIRYLVDDVPHALNDIRGRLGAGVASPDHLVYLAGTKAGCCPATEPQTVTADLAAFDPPVNPDPATSGEGVKILVVDTGLIPSVVAEHAALLAGVTGDEEPHDPKAIGPYVGHGTFIAGIIRCLAPKAEVHVRAIFVNQGAVAESAVAAALETAIEEQHDIISISAGTTTDHNLPAISFQVLWEKYLRHHKGSVLIAAAGNDGNRGPFWPAAAPWAIGVGALDATETTRAPYSDFGGWVDVYTRGSDIVNAFPHGTLPYAEGLQKQLGLSATFDNGFAAWSGTSFATPVFAGMVAGRMSRTGENARDAVAGLLTMARKNGAGGVGSILRLNPAPASQG